MSEFFNFVKTQWHDIKGNAKWDFIKLGALAVIATPAAIIHFIGHAPLWEVLVVLVVSTICGAVLFCVILFAIKKWGTPKSKEQINKELLDKIAKRNFPERFEPELGMEIIHPVDLDILTSRRTYRIIVKNRDKKKYITNVKVSISEIKWPKSAEKPLVWSGIIFPYQLPEKGKLKQGSCELAGDSEMEFDLMFVEFFHMHERLINLAPFQPTNPPSPSVFKSVVSQTRFGIETLPKDDSNLFFIFKVSGGNGDVATITESYNLKVPPFASVKNMDDAVENVNALNRNPASFLPVFEKSTQDSDAKIKEAKPFEISAFSKKLSVNTHWNYANEIEILNLIQSLSGVKLQLINIEPPLHANYGTSERYDLDAIEYPLLGSSDRVLNQNMKCRVRLFVAELSGGITMRFPDPHAKSGELVFAPQYENGIMVEHILTLAVSAVGVPACFCKFKMIFQTDNQGPPVKLEEI